MGVSASAYLHVGFEVTEEDFWAAETQTDDHLSCPKGHTEGAKKGKHCSDCGGKFAYQSREVNIPTHELKEIAVTAKVAAEKIVPPDDWQEADPKHLDGLDVFCSDAYSDSDTDESAWAMGVLLMRTGDILHMEDSNNFKSSRDLQDAVRKVTNMRDRLGLDERPVGVYLCGSCSY